MAGHPLRPATRRRLGRPLPHQQADRPRAHPRPESFTHNPMRGCVISSISSDFPKLSQSLGQVTHVLLTRSPLFHPASWASSFDLHVLSTPPAFVLSQDQTLRKKLHAESQRNKPTNCEFNLTKTNINTDVHIICPKGIAIHPQSGWTGL